MSAPRPATALGNVTAPRPHQQHPRPSMSSSPLAHLRGAARAVTAAAGMTREEARRHREAEERVIPGEHFYKSFDDQLGEKCGLVTWTHRKEMRKIHCDQIRWSKSYVMLDVAQHREAVEHTRKIWFQPERDARVKMRADQKIARENEEMLNSIKKRLSEDTPITLAAKPGWTRRHKHFKKTRKKLQRLADAEKMRYRNRDNLDLLKLIHGARAYYDPQDWKESFRRHKRLKKAMRKVDDPKKKRQSARQCEAQRLRKPEKLHTRSETLLGELYNHALSPKFVQTYCDKVTSGVGEQEQEREQVEGGRPTPTPMQRRRGGGGEGGGGGGGARLALDDASWGRSLLLSSASLGLRRSLNSRGWDAGAGAHQDWGGRVGSGGRGKGGVGQQLPGEKLEGDEEEEEEEWNEAEQAKLMVMFPERLSLGGLNVVAGVWRAREADLALRIRIEDPKTGAQRTVYLSHEAMRRMCKRYPQLLDDTFSQVRAGKGNTRSKGGRMKSLLLLLDLSGAFKREIDMMRAPSPSVMRLRAQTAMGRARQSQVSWGNDRQLRAGTAGPISPSAGHMGSLITSPEQQRRQQLGEQKRPSTSAL
jgi:hypothetical protein